MKTGALILAAGNSSRLGQPKQLLRFRGRSLVRRAAAAALGAGCSPVAIVLGAERERIETELSRLPVSFVPNDDWFHGIGSSIRAGVEALQDCAAIAILACDQPYVDEEVIKRLLQAQKQTQKPIVACAYDGTLGIPALFARANFQKLLSLGDEQGAKSLISAQPNDVAPLQFPGGNIDIDTADDFAKLCS